MRKLIATSIGVVAATAALSIAAGATVRSPTGDACVATGTGFKYTLSITLPASTPEQGGFAVGAPGVKITNLSVADSQGGMQAGAASTQNLPPNTTEAWLFTGPALVAGSTVIASLTTSASVTGSFTVIPLNLQHTTYYDPLVCQHPQGTPTPSNTFSIQHRFVYSSATGTWHAFATVPGSGKLSFSQRRTRPGDTAKLSIAAGRLSVTGAGKVKVTLVPTASGRAELAKSGSITLNLSIEFSPKNGKPANKLLALTLKK
jgi:hypothetical protein